MSATTSRRSPEKPTSARSPATQTWRSADAGAPVANLTSAGVAIAEHRLFVTSGGASYAPATGYVIAYTAP